MSFEELVTLVPMSEQFIVMNNSTLNITENITYSTFPVMLASKELEITRFIVQRILSPLLVTGGVLGNIFNIIVLRNKKMRSSTNVYLTALAVCDTLYLIFMIALSLIDCNNRDLPGFLIYFHPVGRVFSDMFGNTAVWLTVAFTLERYVGVCHPMKGKAWCTIRKAKLAAFSVTILCFCTTLPEFLEMEIVEIEASNSLKTYLKCQNTEFGNSDSYQIGYFWWYVTFFTIIPLILLSIFNSTLIASVWKANKARRTLSNSCVVGETTRHATEQQKVTTMLIAVVIIFLICQFPWAILLIYKAYTSAHNIPVPRDKVRITGNVCNILVVFNASINFLLYSYFSSRFRRVFKQIICSLRKPTPTRRKSTISSSSDAFRKSGSSKESTSTTSCRSKRTLVSDTSANESLLGNQNQRNIA